MTTEDDPLAEFDEHMEKFREHMDRFWEKMAEIEAHMEEHEDRTDAAAPVGEKREVDAPATTTDPTEATATT